MLKYIQKKLPDDIIVIDETDFEFTEDEYISILSWIKCFDIHYKENKKNKHMPVQLPLISKRMRLDFAFYRFPCNLEKDNGEFIVYISDNRDEHKKERSVSKLINIWDL